MSALVQAQANSIINATLAGSAAGASTGIKLRLTTSASSATSAGTELSGTGYTSGGSVVTWNSASSGSTTNSDSASWTNGGSTWSIVSGELWDEAGTPLRWWYFNWTGQPVSIASGNTFSVATGAITITLS